MRRGACRARSRRAPPTSDLLAELGEDCSLVNSLLGRLGPWELALLIELVFPGRSESELTSYRGVTQQAESKNKQTALRRARALLPGPFDGGSGESGCANGAGCNSK